MRVRSASVEQLVEQALDPAIPLPDRHDAFAALVERSQHIVFKWALSLLRNADEARDAAQDTFLTAWLCLPRLRDASAFTGWLKRIVVTQCHRRLRRRGVESSEPATAVTNGTEAISPDDKSLLASAIAGLPEGERDVVVLSYYLGCTQQEVSRLMRLKPGTVGKRLHSARIRIRRRLPDSVRRDFVPLVRSRAFIQDVRRGLFDEYIGEYRFEHHPDRVVSITRQGDRLVSEAGGQRHVLLEAGDGALVTRNYDGEGRFRRNRRGRITGFVYYEFGRRMGVARKMPNRFRPAPSGM